MSHSKLVSYVRSSPNKSSREGCKIDTITIHCMAANITVETCGALFAKPSRKASSNYGIDSSGKIACYVEEEYRSWCTSSRANDRRAVTIEVANSVAKDPWPITKEAYESLVLLCADICKRNGIKKLLWKNDSSLIGNVSKQNMTVHRWFAAKACPGNALLGKHYDLANRVNAILSGEENPKEVRFTETPVTLSGVVTASLGLNVRKDPSTTEPSVGLLSKGTSIKISAKTSNGWYKIPNGYVCDDYVDVVEEGEEMITQEQFNAFMNNWLKSKESGSPEEWSAESRSFCEDSSIIRGNSSGDKKYGGFVTREELAAVVYRTVQYTLEAVKKTLSESK